MPKSNPAKGSSACAASFAAKDAWKTLKSDPKAVLIDVRTAPEWSFVGIPDLSEMKKDLLQLSWRIYPNMEVNKNFVSQITSEIPDKNTPIFFMCRSGGRSMEAATAMTAEGYTKCYNILDGFEGDMNEEFHRSEKSGWRAAKLPWRQT